MAHEGSSESELLPLTAGEFGPVGAEHRVEAIRQRIDEVGGGRPLERRGCRVMIPETGKVADADVLVGDDLEAGEVLEAGRHPRPPLLDGDVAEVDAVDGDASGGRVVEPAQQLHQRRLAGAVHADQSDRRARRQEQVDTGEDR